MFYPRLIGSLFLFLGVSLRAFGDECDQITQGVAQLRTTRQKIEALPRSEKTTTYLKQLDQAEADLSTKGDQCADQIMSAFKGLPQPAPETTPQKTTAANPTREKTGTPKVELVSVPQASTGNQFSSSNLAQPEPGGAVQAATDQKLKSADAKTVQSGDNPTTKTLPGSGPLQLMTGVGAVVAGQEYTSYQVDSTNNVVLSTNIGKKDDRIVARSGLHSTIQERWQMDQ